MREHVHTAVDGDLGAGQIRGMGEGQLGVTVRDFDGGGGDIDGHGQNGVARDQGAGEEL